MRKIKFRAWHTVDKEMIDWDQMQEHSIPFIFGYGTLEVMQYTGLKDKNGKEIFDDDIFKAPHDFGPGGIEMRKEVVHFHETQGYQWNYWLINELVIIGNKWENPELLGEVDHG